MNHYQNLAIELRLLMQQGSIKFFVADDVLINWLGTNLEYVLSSLEAFGEGWLDDT